MSRPNIEGRLVSYWGAGQHVGRRIGFVRRVQGGRATIQALGGERMLSPTSTPSARYRGRKARVEVGRIIGVYYRGRLQEFARYPEPKGGRP